MNFHLTYLFCLLSLSVLMSCSQTDRNCRSFAESWDGKCPVVLVEGEISLTHVRYSEGEFFLSVSLSDKAPVSVFSLRQLNEEYSRRMQDVEDYYRNGKEIGGLPFIKGIISQSTVLTQMIDTIASLTGTAESTQGYLPAVISISDETDSLAYVYNEEWEHLTEYEWLNAILPMDILKAFGWLEYEELPILNKEVKFSGTPLITEDGYLRISCSYDAMPYFRETHTPLRITEVREKYFNEILLKDYLVMQEKKSEPIHRYLQACKCRGIGVKFVIEGDKDCIDKDLSTPEQIKEWKSWGGCDSLVVRSF